ncbi:MAG: DNA-methyltransferase [Methanothermobacter tenebrarum]
MVKLTLIQGDCLKALSSLNDKSIDLIVTDPPFFMRLDSFKISNKGKKGSEFKFFRKSFADLSVFLPFFNNLFIEIERIMKPTGRIYIFCDGQTYPIFWYYLFPFTKIVRPLVWDKKTSLVGYTWRHQFEIIVYAEMPIAKPVPTGEGDIISYPAVKLSDRMHPAEKPVGLLEKIISKSSSENDIVLDMFLGSGATMEACLRTERNCIGIEIEPAYIEICKKRLNWGSTLYNVQFEFKVIE